MKWTLIVVIACAVCAALIYFYMHYPLTFILVMSVGAGVAWGTFIVQCLLIGEAVDSYVATLNRLNAAIDSFRCCLNGQPTHTPKVAAVAKTASW
jgi:hypothetical protein